MKSCCLFYTRNCFLVVAISSMIFTDECISRNVRIAHRKKRGRSKKGREWVRINWYVVALPLALTIRPNIQSCTPESEDFIPHTRNQLTKNPTCAHCRFSPWTMCKRSSQKSLEQNHREFHPKIFRKIRLRDWSNWADRTSHKNVYARDYIEEDFEEEFPWLK